MGSGFRAWLALQVEEGLRVIGLGDSPLSGFRGEGFWMGAW